MTGFEEMEYHRDLIYSYLMADGKKEREICLKIIKGFGIQPIINPSVMAGLKKLMENI